MRLSVVIPVLNGAQTIAAQLDALAAQKLDEPWELILADNGSTDETVSICKSFADRIPNLSVIDAPGRHSPGHARNIGVVAARSESLAFLDADDIAAPGWLSAMATALVEHDFVAGLIDCTALNAPWVLQTRQPMPHLFEDFSKPWSVVPSCNLGIKRSLFETVGGFSMIPKGLGCEDDDFSVRVQMTGARPFFATNALVHYRYRTNLLDIFRQARSYGRGDAFMFKTYRHIDYWEPYLTPLHDIIGYLVRIRSKADIGHLLWLVGERIGRRGW